MPVELRVHIDGAYESELSRDEAVKNRSETEPQGNQRTIDLPALHRASRSLSALRQSAVVRFPNGGHPATHWGQSH